MSKRRILVVDDDISVLHMLEDGIKLYCADCQVVRATDGLMALRQLERQPFDLVLTDYDMPGMNGLELAQTVRQTAPHTRIVLMSGRFTGGELQDRLRALGLEACIGKPFSMKQIRDILRVSRDGVS